jgi:hypothetical protein
LIADAINNPIIASLPRLMNVHKMTLFFLHWKRLIDG